jgi:uncharacterized protein YaaN involved in tellurite resistance
MLQPTKVASFDMSAAVREENGQMVVVDRNQLPADVGSDVDKAMATISFGNQAGISNYGTDAQKNISALSSNILASVKTKDTGDVGVMLTGLVKNIKDIDCRSLSGANKGFLHNLLHKIADPLQSFVVKQKSVSANIEVVAKDLEKKRVELLESVKLLDKMYEQTGILFKSLQIYLIAGFMKLREERESVLKDLEAKAMETKDNADVQNFEDYRKTLDRFEKRLHDMTVARHVALLQGPQIRQMQHNSTLLAEEIQNSILNAIPAWQQAMVLAIEAYKTRSAMETQKLVKNTVNDLLKSNSEMLKTTSIEVSKMAQETLIEFDTVMKMQDNLLSSIDAVKQIEEEGRKKRESEVQQLISKENELKDRIMKKV